LSSDSLVLELDFTGGRLLNPGSCGSSHQWLTVLDKTANGGGEKEWLASQPQWHGPTIPVLRRQRQEDPKSKATLVGYMVRAHLKIKQGGGWTGKILGRDL
jgi:hypothetical protein